MSTTIKTQYQDVHNLLQDNAGKKLTTKLMDQFVELMQSKVMAKTFKKDDEGIVTHVYCYYHKEWENISEIDYGKKASTSTGLNTMCKQGVSNWTKQQRVMKLAKAKLLDDVASGEVEASELANSIALIDEQAKQIKPYEVTVVETEEVEA